MTDISNLSNLPYGELVKRLENYNPDAAPAESQNNPAENNNTSVFNDAKTDEKGDYITTGTWGEADAFSSLSEILQREYGYEYGSAEADAVLEALKADENNAEFFASGDDNIIPANTNLYLVSDPNAEVD